MKKLLLFACLVFSMSILRAERTSINVTKSSNMAAELAKIETPADVDTLVVSSTVDLSLEDLREIRAKFLSNGDGTFTLDLSKALFAGNVFPGPGSGNDGAFDQLKALKEVMLPITLKQIGRVAFRECANLEKINLPEGLEVLKGNCFAMTGLKGKLALKNLPSTITKIESYAFYQLKTLALNSLPVSLQGEIASNSFAGTAVAITEIPEGITKISSSAFAGKSNDTRKINSIMFPTTLEILHVKAFDSQHNLKVVEFKNIEPPMVDGGDSIHFPTDVTIIVPNEEAVASYMEIPAFAKFTIQAKTTTDLSAAPTAEFSLYPNPVVDELNISFLEPIKDVKLYDMTGRMLENLTGQAGTYNVSHLNTGIYFVQVNDRIFRFVKK